MTMTDHEDKIIEAKRRKVQELEEGNLRSYNELGQTIRDEFKQIVDMDTTPVRIATLIDALVATGAWSESNRLDFEIAFQLKVEANLKEEWTKLRAALEERSKPKLSVVKQPSVLLDQRGRPIGG